MEEGKDGEEFHPQWEPGEDGLVGVSSVLVLRTICSHLNQMVLQHSAMTSDSQIRIAEIETSDQTVSCRELR